MLSEREIRELWKALALEPTRIAAVFKLIRIRAEPNDRSVIPEQAYGATGDARHKNHVFTVRVIRHTTSLTYSPIITCLTGNG